MEHLQGRTGIVCEHFKELFTDPSHAEVPEWIGQETLHSLPLVDGERVQEVAFTWRKRTSRAEDHVVIEMLRELDSDFWETVASCFQFRLMNHGCRQFVETTAGYYG